MNNVLVNHIWFSHQPADVQGCFTGLCLFCALPACSSSFYFKFTITFEVQAQQNCAQIWEGTMVFYVVQWNGWAESGRVKTTQTLFVMWLFLGAHISGWDHIPSLFAQGHSWFSSRGNCQVQERAVSVWVILHTPSGSLCRFQAQFKPTLGSNPKPQSGQARVYLQMSDLDFSEWWIQEFLGLKSE